jgi:hypothetical protein
MLRYKIYAEGATWSVSNKYIIACDSMTMFIEPRYYDFFTRSMLPLKHYWPISFKNMCEEIKYAVDWGNAHLDSVIIFFLNFPLNLSYIKNMLKLMSKKYASFIVLLFI